MTVVSFTPRFTSADISAFDAIAWPRLSTGLWSHVERNTCGDGDQILVYLPCLPLPTFRFERDRQGTYTLWFRSASSPDWAVICASSSAWDCLSLWGRHEAHRAGDNPRMQPRDAGLALLPRPAGLGHFVSVR
jgi:hypothetical protein